MANNTLLPLPSISPDRVVVPSNVILEAICVVETEFCAISEEPTWLAAILADVIALSAIFAVSTELLAKCIASIEPVISSALSTEFAAKSPAAIVPSVIWSEDITPEGSLAAVIALSAILAVVT